ncbi:MAG: hypothetical protein RIF41_00025 [Polyangiaceae bacterium]
MLLGALDASGGASRVLEVLALAEGAASAVSTSVLAVAPERGSPVGSSAPWTEVVPAAAGSEEDGGDADDSAPSDGVMTHASVPITTISEAAAPNTASVRPLCMGGLGRETLVPAARLTWLYGVGIDSERIDSDGALSEGMGPEVIGVATNDPDAWRPEPSVSPVGMAGGSPGVSSLSGSAPGSDILSTIGSGSDGWCFRGSGITAVPPSPTGPEGGPRAGAWAAAARAASWAWTLRLASR